MPLYPALRFAEKGSEPPMAAPARVRAADRFAAHLSPHVLQQAGKPCAGGTLARTSPAIPPPMRMPVAETPRSTATVDGSPGGHRVRRAGGTDDGAAASGGMVQDAGVSDGTVQDAGLPALAGHGTAAAGPARLSGEPSGAAGLEPSTDAAGAGADAASATGAPADGGARPASDIKTVQDAAAPAVTSPPNPPALPNPSALPNPPALPNPAAVQAAFPVLDAETRKAAPPVPTARIHGAGKPEDEPVAGRPAGSVVRKVASGGGRRLPGHELALSRAGATLPGLAPPREESVPSPPRGPANDAGPSALAALSAPIGQAPSAPVADAAGAPAVPAPAPPGEQLTQAFTNLRIRADGGSELTIRLDPAELGQVQVQISRSHDGDSTISIAVERPETLRTLQADLTRLHQALDRAGLPEQRSLVLHLAPPQDFGGGPAFQGGGQPGQQGNSQQAPRHHTGQTAGAAAPVMTPIAAGAAAMLRTTDWHRAGVDITA